MVLNNAIPTRPSPEDSGPGGSDRRAACGELIAAGVQLAVLTPITGLALFAALQCTRIELWRQIWAEAREGSAATLAPDEVARYAGWFWASRNLWMREERGVSWDGVIRRLFDEPEPRFVLVGWVVLVFLFAVALGAAMSVLASRSRLVPYELAWSSRARLVAAAMRSAVPWSVAAGMAACGVCWHVGFDRVGGSISLLEGLVPTTVQAASAFGVWALSTALLASCFVRPSVGGIAAEAGLAAVCAWCRYPRRGVSGGVCPECGTECAQHMRSDYPTTLRVHRRIARGVAVFSAILGLAACAAAAVSDRAADWLRLRPPEPGWVFTPGNCELDEAPMQLDTIYGKVSVSAQRSPSDPDGSWLVRWSLQPRDSSVHLDRDSSFVVSQPPGSGTACAVRKETPAGPLWFWRTEDHDRLLIGTPQLIVR